MDRQTHRQSVSTDRNINRKTDRQVDRLSGQTYRETERQTVSINQSDRMTDSIGEQITQTYRWTDVYLLFEHDFLLLQGDVVIVLDGDDHGVDPYGDDRAALLFVVHCHLVEGRTNEKP